ncbi:MAG TPA: hypothetical protein PKE04_15280 [Clostridia bacterium]|nr:hypothetical protein [Clostridia bacterium]
MIYLKIKSRTIAPPGQPIVLGDVAQVLADAKWGLAELPISLPQERGIWLVDAVTILSELQRRCPGETVTVLGDSIGWLHRSSRGMTRKKLLRAAWAVTALALGAAAIALLSRVSAAWARQSWSLAAGLVEDSSGMMWLGFVSLGLVLLCVAAGVLASIAGRGIRGSMAVKLREEPSEIPKKTGRGTEG